MTQTTRQRAVEAAARAIAARQPGCNPDTAFPLFIHTATTAFDAIMAAIEEPGEEAVRAGTPKMIDIPLGNGTTFPTPGLGGGASSIWSRMLSAIREGRG